VGGHTFSEPNSDYTIIIGTKIIYDRIGTSYERIFRRFNGEIKRAPLLA